MNLDRENFASPYADHYAFLGHRTSNRDELRGRIGRYAALSYAWGDGLPLRLTRAVKEGFRKEIPWEEIPKTLQDAMIIMHRLGLRYLWVDALTII